MGKILVTGGAGFIGSHTCVELLERGKEIVVVDNFVNSTPKALEAVREITGREFEFYECDLRDRAGVERIFCENEISAAIHFAGLKAVGESVQKPRLYYDNNLGSTLGLLEAMERHGVKKLIFSSSATVYGEKNAAPYREEMETGGTTNPYGTTKWMIERMLADECAADPAWGVVLLRYFNPIGAHPSGLLREDPNGIPNNLMPYIVRVAQGKLPYLNVFGGDYPTPDGTGVRDYIHVCDLAAGHGKALDWLETHRGVEAFNLGTGKGSSVLEVLHAYERASGREVPYRVAPRRAGDLAVSYADCSKAQKLLGWHAQFSLDDMCRDTFHAG